MGKLAETGETAAARGVSVVIPSWNGRALLEKFLPSVVHSLNAFQIWRSLPCEIVIADDGSTDDTAAWLSAHHPEVRWETAKLHLGFAPTVNRGVRAARYSWVYVLNNDVAIEVNTLKTLIPHFDDPAVFGVSGQMYEFASGLLRGGGSCGQFRRGFLGVHERYYVNDSDVASGAPYLTFWVTGGSVMYDREKFLALGGFEELFAPFGWEDVEICVKAWKQGFVVHYEPRSAVWHQVSSTIGPRFGRQRVRAVYERNRLWTHWMHLDTTSQLAAHAGMVALKLVSEPFALRWQTWSALLQALKALPQVSRRRRELLRRRRYSLVEVMERIARASQRPEIKPYQEETAQIRACPSLGEAQVRS